MTVQNGWSDFCKTLTVMKVFYKKQKANIATYWNYKHSSNEELIFDDKKFFHQMMTSENNGLEFDQFKAALDEAI